MNFLTNTSWFELFGPAEDVHMWWCPSKFVPELMQNIY